MIKMSMRLAITVVVLQIVFACSNPARKVLKISDGYEISNERVKVVCMVNEDREIEQYFYAINKEGLFVEVAKTFKPDFTNISTSDIARIYDTSWSVERYLVSEFEGAISAGKDGNSIIITGRKGDVHLTQKISLNEDGKSFHIEVSCEFPNEENQIDYLLSTYEYNLEKAPFFIHTPGLKFDNEESQQHRWKIIDSQDQVIGDRSYHSPAIILQEESLFAALVPDLEHINKSKVVSPDARRTGWIKKNHFQVDVVEENFTLPTALDLNVKSGLTPKPVMAYGYMDAIISHHIRYNRFNDESMLRTFKGKKLEYAFDLVLDASARDYTKYGDVAKLIWEKHGHEEFRKGRHLAMPFEEYHRIVDSITFNPNERKDIDIPLQGHENTGSWLQWEDKNGVKMGGYRSAINHHNDELHNSQFWNNAREATGFWYWGNILNYEKDIDRSRRIINWCLDAPQNENGLFATFYKANERRWAPQFSDPMHGKTRFFLDDSDSYDISIMSKTGAHLLHYYMSCEQDERIIDYLQPYAEWLLTVIDERGAVPTYASKDMKLSDILLYSAQPASSAWFLAEFYNATNQGKYLKGAERITGYLSKEIIPEAKWIDSEQFYSCGNRPLFFQRDIVQNQIARGSLCIMWAVEAYQALHEATQSEQYLKEGEACVDYLTFFQCSWNPHYVYTAYPFGGFSVDNADSGTYLDARQADVVKSFIYFGKALGRQDLLERAVAAARSSIVLINHPLHKSNGIYEHTNIYPFGLGPENIDHEAYPQSAMRTHPSWGEGSGIYTGLAEALRGLGSLYVNLDKQLAVGVDGLIIKEIQYHSNYAELNIESCLSEKYLVEPWKSNYRVKIKVDGQADYLIVNGIQFDVENNEVELDITKIIEL